MLPIEFKQQSALLAKPAGMTDKECGPLPIYSDGQMCVSLWQMSWRERLSSLFFGRMWLFVYSGKTQPPVSLLATQDIFEKGE